MTDLPPFPEVFSATARSALVACERQFFYKSILRLVKYEGRSVHLVFGGCFAKGLEVTRKAYWRDGKDEIAAIAEGIKSLIIEWGDYELPPGVENSSAKVKTLPGCIDAFVSYFEKHQLGNDAIRPLMVQGEPMVEVTFTLPFPGCIHPTTGNPILFTGRFDMLGVYQDAVFVIDEKTSVRLGATWRSNWLLSGQLSAYAWGGRSFLPPDMTIQGCVVRGIGILQSQITFEEAILSRPEWQVDQWLAQAQRDINRAANIYRRAMDSDDPHLYWDQAFDQACSSYGGCGYSLLCDSPDPRRWYGEYVVRPWNPLEREAETT